MAAILSFLCAVALMLLMKPIPGHTECVTARNNDKEYLKCSDMSIDEIDDYLDIESLEYLEMSFDRLYLHGVNFTSLRKLSEWLPMISYLEVTRNNADMDETVIYDFRNLNVFNVSESGTANIFKGFYNYGNNSHLNIIFDNNNIYQVTSICQYYTNITSWNLSLKHNKITTFTLNKDNITLNKDGDCNDKLKKLDLKHNNLISFDANMFAEMSGLEWIDLSYNKIVKFDNSIVINRHTVISLKVLYLDNNNILDLEKNNFKYLNKLEVLSISFNNIRNIHIDSFNSLSKLELLDLSNNKLTSLDPRVFSGLDALTKLHINVNLLVKFDAQKFQHIFNSLQYISLNDNQWDCVELMVLVNYLSDKHVNFMTALESSVNVKNTNGVNCNGRKFKRYFEAINCKEKLLQLNANQSAETTQIEQKLRTKCNENITLLKDIYNADILQLKANESAETSQINQTFTTKCNEHITLLKDSCDANILQLKANQSAEISQIKERCKTICNENITLLKDSCDANILQFKANQSAEISQIKESCKTICNENITLLKDSCDANILQLKANQSEETSNIKETCKTKCNDDITLLKENHNAKILQLKENCSAHLLKAVDINELTGDLQSKVESLTLIIVVLSVILIVMIIISVFLGVKLIRAYRSDLEGSIAGGVKFEGKRDRPPIREEEHHHDNVELTGNPSQSRDVTSCICEEPPQIPTHFTT